MTALVELLADLMVVWMHHIARIARTRPVVDCPIMHCLVTEKQLQAPCCGPVSTSVCSPQRSTWCERLRV